MRRGCASLQHARAAEIVRFAMAHTAYYRERYARAGIDPRDLADPQSFQSLPVLERAEVRENFERIRSAEATPSNVQRAVTGGTTGEPLRVLRDDRANHRTLGWRLHRWWGVGPSDNKARHLAGRRHRFLEDPATRGALVAHPHAWRWTPTTSTSGPPPKFLDGWERIRPALLTGYVGAVIELAQFVKRSGRAIPPPKAVATTSAPITPGQKQFLAEVFGAPVYDHYQCVESPMLAGECARSDGLHVFADSRWVEILDGDGRAVGPGETGNVVITDFRNRVFPLIRYRLGDLARWKEGAVPVRRHVPDARAGPRAHHRRAALPERPRRRRRRHVRDLPPVARGGPPVPAAPGGGLLADLAVRTRQRSECRRDHAPRRRPPAARRCEARCPYGSRSSTSSTTTAASSASSSARSPRTAGGLTSPRRCAGSGPVAGRDGCASRETTKSDPAGQALGGPASRSGSCRHRAEHAPARVRGLPGSRRRGTPRAVRTAREVARVQRRGDPGPASPPGPLGARPAPRLRGARIR